MKISELVICANCEPRCKFCKHNDTLAENGESFMGFALVFWVFITFLGGAAGGFAGAMLAFWGAFILFWSVFIGCETQRK